MYDGHSAQVGFVRAKWPQTSEPLLTPPAAEHKGPGEGEVQRSCEFSSGQTAGFKAAAAMLASKPASSASSATREASFCF
jgi:hypothetical protein